MSVGFDGMGRQTATFQAGSVSAGSVVIMGGNGKVRSAGAGHAPVGVVLNCREGYASVQTGGFVRAAWTGTAPALGWTALTTNGAGGVKAAGEGDKSRSCLVVEVNETDKTAGLFL